MLTFAVEALVVRTSLSGFSVDLVAKVAKEVFEDMPMDNFDGICVLLMELSDELTLIVGTLLVVRFLIKVDCGDELTVGVVSVFNLVLWVDVEFALLVTVV